MRQHTEKRSLQQILTVNSGKNEAGALYIIAYMINKKRLITEEVGELETYGISAKKKYVGEPYELSVDVEDISPDFDQVEELFQLISREAVLPEHLLDVIEDWIAS